MISSAPNTRMRVPKEGGEQFGVTRMGVPMEGGESAHTEFGATSLDILMLNDHTFLA